MLSSGLRSSLVVLITLLFAGATLRPLPAGAFSDSPSTVLFGSMDAGRSPFLTTGAKIATDDLGRDGFVTLVSLGGGVREERGVAAPGQRAPTFLRTTVIGAALGGYQFCFDWGVLSLFAGPEASLEMLGDSSAPVALPSRFGLRLQGEVWMRTGPNTLTTLTLILGSARWDVYGRSSAGYRLWGAYIGPEIAYYGERTGYEKVSVGLHATDFSLGPLSLRVGTGLLYERETDRLGPYVALAAWASLPWSR